MRSSRWLTLGIAAAAALGCDSTPRATGATSALAPTTALTSMAAADDGVRVYQFRTEEDPEVTGGAAFCATAPFAANVVLNASAYSVRTRAVDGRVVNQDAARVGTALACAQLTNFTFPPGLQQNFYARFDLPDGSYTAQGTCTLISNNVPVTGLVLAGCTLKLVDSPDGVIGGAATSLSVFNPRRLAGFATGSQWTIQAYEESP
jgi:hypothetical protein